MRALVLIFSWVLLMGADAIDRPRIVSTSLCGDSYVLSVVAVEDIAALSWQSGHALSNVPHNLRNKPKAWDDAERLLALNPTLVVFGPGEGGAAKPVLDKHGIKYVALDWGEGFASVVTNTAILQKHLLPDDSFLDVFGLIKHQTMQAGALSSLPQILYLSASGGTAGPGTYVDAAIKAAGGRNIITIQGWHTPDVETLVGLEPDLIVTSFFEDGYASVNEAGLNNKVLQDKIKSTAHDNVPGKLWPCAGPGLYEATDIIAKAIEELP